MWGVEASTEEQPRLQGQVVSTHDREPKLQGTMCVFGSAVTPSCVYIVLVRRESHYSKNDVHGMKRHHKQSVTPNISNSN